MTTRSQHCPDVYDYFMLGAFASNVTQNRFSSAGLDQAHEHLNAQVKGDGGALGLTEKPGALRRWMVAGSQLSTIIAEERFGLNDGHEADGQHHEQSHSYQKSFFEDFYSFVAIFEELRNRFLDHSNDLVTTDTQEILPETVVETVGKIHLRGAEQYKSCIEERLLKNDTPISGTIARNSFALLSRRNKVVQWKDNEKIAELKSDCSCLLYTSPSPRDRQKSRMPSSA